MIEIYFDFHICMFNSFYTVKRIVKYIQRIAKNCKAYTKK